MDIHAIKNYLVLALIFFTPNSYGQKKDTTLFPKKGLFTTYYSKDTVRGSSEIYYRFRDNGTFSIVNISKLNNNTKVNSFGNGDWHFNPDSNSIILEFTPVKDFRLSMLHIDYKAMVKGNTDSLYLSGAFVDEKGSRLSTSFYTLTFSEKENTASNMVIIPDSATGKFKKTLFFNKAICNPIKIWSSNYQTGLTFEQPFYIQPNSNWHELNITIPIVEIEEKQKLGISGSITTPFALISPKKEILLMKKNIKKNYIFGGGLSLLLSTNKTAEELSIKLNSAANNYAYAKAFIMWIDSEMNKE